MGEAAAISYAATLGVTLRLRHPGGVYTADYRGGRITAHVVNGVIVSAEQG